MNNALNQLKKLADISKAKYSLENMLVAYSFLDKPLKDINVVHIAGTNGKGSVSHKIAKSLFYAGYKVGLFTSPHISTIRERIMIDFSIIPKNDFEQELSLLFKSIEPCGLDFNFFEILTLLACSYFKKNRVDFAVMEVGLGGRLDATNVVESNISVITSIGYDHQHLLGDTLEQIASEKAGIIKPNVPLVIGPNAAYLAIIERAKKFSAPLYQVKGSFSSYDEENQHIAEEALSVLKNKFNITSDAIQKGVHERPQCRFEVFDKDTIKTNFTTFPKRVILDVAHNVDGLKRLKKMLAQKFKVDKYIIVLGISKDKDVEKFCNYLLNFAKEIHLAESDHPRLLSPNKISEIIPSGIKIQIHKSFSDAMKMLINKENEHILVLGSFYFMHDIKEILGIKQECDQFNFNESIPKL